MKPVKGFTLVELLTVLAISGLLLGMAIPAVGAMLRSTATTTATNDIVGALNRAREEAITRRVRVVVCRQAGTSASGLPQCAGKSGTDLAHDGYEDGWLIFTDEDHDWQPGQAADILHLNDRISTGAITIRGQSHGNNADHVGFTPLGMPAGSTGSLVVCNDRGWQQNGHEARVVVVSAVGRIRAISGDDPSSTVSGCTP